MAPFIRLVVAIALVVGLFFAARYFTNKTDSASDPTTTTTEQAANNSADVDNKTTATASNNSDTKANLKPSNNDGNSSSSNKQAVDNNKTNLKSSNTTNSAGQSDPKTAAATTPNTNNTATANSDAQASPKATKSSCVFTYKAPEPQNGILKGVVELGSSGFNSFIVNIDKQKNWKLEEAQFGYSMVHENLASTKDIRTGLKEYIQEMVEFGVRGNNIHFVVSSGARGNGKVQKIVAELKDMGYVVNVVNPQQESLYALKAALPPKYKDQAYVIDIGSGNTKIAWYEGKDIKTNSTHGAKYRQLDITDDKVYKEAKKLAYRIAKDKRQQCFIIGGVPFKMAKIDRKGKERYTALRNPANYEGEKDYKKEKFRSGVNIYQGIYDATLPDCVIFDWDANFTIGFLLTL